MSKIRHATEGFVTQKDTELKQYVDTQDLDLASKINDLSGKVDWKADKWKTENDLPSSYPTKSVTYFYANTNLFNGKDHMIVKTTRHLGFAKQEIFRDKLLSKSLYYRLSKAYNVDEWDEWQELATTTKTDILLEPLLSVGWSKLSVTPRCVVNSLGQLQFDGNLQNKTAITSSTVCVLPSNVRPNRNINTFVYAVCSEATFYKDLVEVVIFTDGRIEFRPTKSYTYYSLSSIPSILLTV